MDLGDGDVVTSAVVGGALQNPAPALRATMAASPEVKAMFSRLLDQPDNKVCVDCSGRRPQVRQRQIALA